jgi:hypothetical protein
MKGSKRVPYTGKEVQFSMARGGIHIYQTLWKSHLSYKQLKIGANLSFPKIYWLASGL